jgi:hypothetical protein
MCYLTNIGKYNIILGVNWLDRHQPVLGFSKSRSMMFDHKDCKTNCLKDGLQDTVYHNRAPESATRTTTATGNISMVSAQVACKMAAADPESIIWLQPSDFDKVSKSEDHKHGDCNVNTFKAFVAVISTAGLASITQADFEQYMSKTGRPPMSQDKVKKLVPDYILKKFPDLFSPQLANVLPPRRPGVDYVIDLNPESGIPKPHIYGCTHIEAETVKTYVQSCYQSVRTDKTDWTDCQGSVSTVSVQSS